MRTFVPYTISGQQYILAAYTCTPLVKIPVSDLKPGAQVKGAEIADLGAGNQPLDMVPYKKDGHDYILIANTSFGVVKLKADNLETYPAIDSPHRHRRRRRALRQDRAASTTCSTSRSLTMSNVLVMTGNPGRPGLQSGPPVGPINLQDDRAAVVMSPCGNSSRRLAVILFLGMTAAAQDISIQFEGGAFRVAGWKAARRRLRQRLVFRFRGLCGPGDVPPLLGTYAVEGGASGFSSRLIPSLRACTTAPCFTRPAAARRSRRHSMARRGPPIRGARRARLSFRRRLAEQSTSALYLFFRADEPRRSRATHPCAR